MKAFTERTKRTRSVYLQTKFCKYVDLLTLQSFVRNLKYLRRANAFPELRWIYYDDVERVTYSWRKQHLGTRRTSWRLHHEERKMNINDEAGDPRRSQPIQGTLRGKGMFGNSWNWLQQNLFAKNSNQYDQDYLFQASVLHLMNVKSAYLNAPIRLDIYSYNLRKDTKYLTTRHTGPVI